MEVQPDAYKTISEPAKGEFKDKGSRFLAFAHPISNESEVKEIVEKYRKEYFDARHHCFAYRLDPEKLLFRSYDDGEPSGTAGKPILGQLQSFDVVNVLIVVVRYFGGTLLGTGGLINAYRESAIDALRNANIVTRFICDNFQVHFGYIQMNDVMKIVKDNNLETSNMKFEIECSMVIQMRRSQTASILEKFNKVEGLNIEQL